MIKKEKSDFLKEVHVCGAQDPLKYINTVLKHEIPLTNVPSLADLGFTAPNLSERAENELRNIERESKLDIIISKIDALNEKPDILKVLLDLGMSLTILEKADMEIPCLTFEGVNTYIKLTKAQYNTLKACGVPDLI